MDDTLIPRATEITTAEYIDLAWQAVTQNPAKAISGGWGLGLLVLVVMMYRRGTSKQP